MNVTQGKTIVGEIFQNAATVSADGQALPCGGLSGIAIQVTGMNGDTVYFEGTLDGSHWVGTQALKDDDGTVATTATADGIYLVNLAGKDQFRCRLVRVLGAVTVIGKGLENAAAFSRVAVGSGGGTTPVKLNVVTPAAGNYTVQATDQLIRVDATAGDATATLPTPAAGNIGKVFWAEKIDASANNVLLAASGGGTVNGVTGTANQWQTLTVIQDTATTYVAF